MNSLNYGMFFFEIIFVSENNTFNINILELIQ